MSLLFWTTLLYNDHDFFFFFWQAYGWAYIGNRHNTWEQFYVYWIPSFTGAILAAWVFRFIFLQSSAKVKKAWGLGFGGTSKSPIYDEQFLDGATNSPVACFGSHFLIIREGSFFFCSETSGEFLQGWLQTQATDWRVYYLAVLIYRVIMLFEYCLHDLLDSSLNP